MANDSSSSSGKDFSPFFPPPPSLLLTLPQENKRNTTTTTTTYFYFFIEARLSQASFLFRFSLCIEEGGSRQSLVAHQLDNWQQIANYHPHSTPFLSLSLSLTDDHDAFFRQRRRHFSFAVCCSTAVLLHYTTQFA